MEKVSLNDFQKRIFLAPFPFSDLTLDKVRPVLVLSNKRYNRISDDVLVCAISSKLNKTHSINLTTKDLDEGVLFKNSIVKYDTIFKLDKQLLIKSIGLISENKFQKIKQKIFALF